MQIFIKNTGHKTFTIDIDETDTIRTLLVVINNLYNIPINYFYLTYAGKILSPENYNLTLIHFDIKKESTLHFHYRSSGIPVII